MPCICYIPCYFSLKHHKQGITKSKNDLEKVTKNLGSLYSSGVNTLGLPIKVSNQCFIIGAILPKLF